MSTKQKKPKIGVVIGSGSVRSTAALGLFRVLEREGVEVDMIAGTSGGALTGATIALGPTLDDAQQGLLKGLTRDVMTEFNYQAFIQIAMPQIVKFPENFSIFGDKGTFRNLRAHFGNHRIEDLNIPLYIVATDLADGSKVILSEGDLVTAIRASIGIPLIFGPIKYEGRWLLDGGIVDPLPIDIAIKEDCDLIIAMGFETPNQPKVDNFQHHILQVINILENNLTKAQFAFHNIAHHAEIIPIMMDFDFPIGTFDTHLIPQIVEAGEKETEKHLPYIKQVLEQMT